MGFGSRSPIDDGKPSLRVHGGTFQFLDLDIRMKIFSEDWVAQRSEESACVESLTNIFPSPACTHSFDLALPARLRQTG